MMYKRPTQETTESLKNSCCRYDDQLCEQGWRYQQIEYFILFKHYTKVYSISKSSTILVIKFTGGVDAN